MQSVSNEWIVANSQNFLPLSDVKIEYRVENIDCKTYFSQMLQSWGTFLFRYTPQVITDTIYNNFIILDYGSFVLDGSCVPYDSNTNVGWILSPDSSSYGIVNISFSQTITSTLESMTFKWGETNGLAPGTVEVEWFDGVTSLGSVTYNRSDGEVISNITLNATSFNKISFTMRKPRPNTACYLEQIIFGDIMEFGKKDIIKVVQKDAIDPNNLSLPVHSMSFELDNTDERFNPDNPTGIYSYLQEGQEIKLKYGLWINGTFEYIKGGTYFLTSWNVPNNGISATFEANSIIEQLKINYTASSSTAREHRYILGDILYSTIREWFDIDDSLLTNEGYCAIYSDRVTRAEILQYICNADRIKLYIDRDGYVHIDELFDGNLSNLTQESYTIGTNVSYNYGDYELIRPLKEVIMTYATDLSNTDVKETTTVASTGVSQTLENLLISTQQNASDVNNQVKNVLINKKRISGSFRPDIRLDVWDKIYVTNKYATNLSVLITELEITYNGAFSGTYKGIIEE